MDSKSINIVAMRFDDLPNESFDTQDHGQLTSAVELRGIDTWVVDLFQARKMRIWWCHPMHFGWFHDDARSWCIRKLRCLAKEWVEKIDYVEVAEPINAKVPVNPARKKCWASRLCVSEHTYPSESSPYWFVLIPAEHMSWIKLPSTNIWAK